MGFERYTEIECDICGKKKTTMGWDDWPQGWHALHVSSSDETYEICSECSKKIYLVAVKFTDDHRGSCETWLVQHADVEALAAGVPAEDIFV